MENRELIKKIKVLKEELKEEGFIIDGIFGSVLRKKNYNDIDLLYHLNESFLKKYNGFKGFKRLEEIKKFLEIKVGKEVDLAPIDNLSKTGKKYILKEVLYV